MKHVRWDKEREARTGVPEVVYGPGKTAAHLREIFENNPELRIASRLSDEQMEVLKDSATIHRTWDEFRSLTVSAGQAPAAIFLNHETLTAQQFVSGLVSNLFTTAPIDAGVKQLSEMVDHAIETCAPDPPRVVLVGYSEGAWIVDQWIRTATPTQLSQIVGVQVFGVPG